ncbi:MAG: tail fiber domain-containing protein [Patescibacteria group bacterium]
MNTKQAKRGFTLIEVLIYTAILSISGSLLSGVLFNTTKIKSRQTAVIEVNEQLGFVLQNIQRSIMDSSIIDIDAGTSTSTLILKFKDDTKNPTKFYITDSIVYKKEASDTAQPLTDSSVIADAVNFLKVSGYSGHDSLQIDLTLSYNTSNPTSAFSRTLSSAIARVSAATFDSNLIPGTTSFYDIGTTALPWNNVYINGSVGIGNTAPLSKLGVTGSASVGATYGVIAAPTSGMIIEGKTGIASSSPWGLLSVNPNGITGPAFVIGSSTATKFIVDNGGKVGIGTTGPGVKLHVADSYTNNGPFIRLQRTDDTAPYGGIQWSASAGTVLWSVENNVRAGQGIEMNEGSTNRMFIKSGGNVGIGTTAPGHKLEVYGDAQAMALNYPTASSYGQLGFWEAGVLKGYIQNIGSTWAEAGRQGDLELEATGDITLQATNGNVGIGTTAPGAKLHVAGTNGQILATGSGYQINPPGPIFGQYASTIGYIQAPAGGQIDIWNDGTGAIATFNDDSSVIFNGKVGIASTTPWGLLSVNPNGITGPAFVIGSSTATNLIVTNGGLVGIGTASPDTMLTVGKSGGGANAGKLKFLSSNQQGIIAIRESGGTYGLDIGMNASTGNIMFDRVVNSVSTNVITIDRDTNGNVGIGNTNPLQKLDITGTIRQTGCITAGTLSANTSGDILCTSDERLKNIYGYYQGGLDALSTINPIRFSYKGEDFVHVGFSAQNVKSVLPEASALQNNGYWSLDNTSIIALTVNAIKEQQKQIEELKAEISELKNK